MELDNFKELEEKIKVLLNDYVLLQGKSRELEEILDSTREELKKTKEQIDSMQEEKNIVRSKVDSILEMLHDVKIP